MSRCTKRDAKGRGCVREAGHCAKHKVRADPQTAYEAGDLPDRPLRLPLWPLPRPETEWSGSAGCRP